MYPKHLWQDGGSEMKGATRAYCTAHGIEQYSTFGGDFKVSIAERAVRTIRLRLSQRFDETQTRAWVDYLPELVKDYNNTVHSAIRMSPNQAWQHPRLAWQALYGTPRDTVEPRYEVGSWVRIARDKGRFEKGAYNWSAKVYEIYSVKPGPAPRYYLRDWSGEEQRGAWYDNELQLLDPDNPTERPTTFLVEKVLKTRIRKGVQESLVRWIGYDEANWVPCADVADLVPPQA